MRTKLGFIVSFFIILCFALGVSYAGERIFEDCELEVDVAGIGAWHVTWPYAGMDNDTYPVPIIQARYKNLYVDGSELGYMLIEDEYLEVSLLGKPRIMGYDGGEDGSVALDGMGDRDWSIDAGAGAKWINEWFSLGAVFVTDVLDEHQGQEAQLTLSKELFEEFITPRVGVKWQSDDLIDYYYGVRTTEVRGNRPAYEGDSTVNYIAGVRVKVPIKETWALIVDFEYENLGDEIKDSPIVDEDETFQSMAGLVYRF